MNAIDGLRIRQATKSQNRQIRSATMAILFGMCLIAWVLWRGTSVQPETDAPARDPTNPRELKETVSYTGAGLVDMATVKHDGHWYVKSYSDDGTSESVVHHPDCECGR